MDTKSRPIIILSGPSGVGKTVVCAEIAKMRPEWESIISHTTRPKRPHEVDGLNYHFITEDAFFDMLRQNRFVEYVRGTANSAFYGYTHVAVSLDSADRPPAIIVMSPTGAMQLLSETPGALAIWLKPPSDEVLVERLAFRGTESVEEQSRRFGIAKAWARYGPMYDKTVTVFTPKQAALEILSIAEADHKGRGL